MSELATLTAASLLAATADPAKAKDFVRTACAREGLASVPRLSAHPPNGSLVRFRGMVQDNGFSPQIFPTLLSLVNSETGETKTVHCHFSDSVPLLSDPASKWRVDDTENNFLVGKYDQKTPLCCVSVPAETTWAVAAETRQESLVDDFARIQIAGESSQNIHVSRKRTTSRPQETLIITKVYGEEPRDLQLGQIIDFIGFLERPTFENRTNEEQAAKTDEMMYDAIHDDDLLQDDMEPFSSLPVIHVLFYQPVSPFAHPLLDESNAIALRQNHKDLRDTTLSYLLPYVQGDALAAEYLLIHMISKIRSRHDDGAVQTGNIPLNLHNISSTAASSAIADAVASLLPRVRTVPLSIQYLNTKRIAPGVFVSREAWNDMQKNLNVTVPKDVLGLVAGELQVPDRTYVVVDEVGMDGGVLKEQGVVNVRHLNDLIACAELPFAVGNGCDSPDHASGKLNVDLSILVLSQAKCMFETPCIVPIHASSNAIPTSELVRPSQDTMDAMRAYLGTVARVTEYTVSDEMASILTQFFMERRRKTAEGGEPLYTQEAFMLRMEIARGIALLCGENGLTEEAWKRSGEMEDERARRRAVGRSVGKVEDNGNVGR